GRGRPGGADVDPASRRHALPRAVALADGAGLGARRPGGRGKPLPRRARAGVQLPPRRLAGRDLPPERACSRGHTEAAAAAAPAERPRPVGGSVARRALRFVRHAARHAALRPRGSSGGHVARRPCGDRPARLDDARAAGLAGRGRRVAEHPSAPRGGDRMTTRVENRAYTLDPVTFEVLKNAFITIVDQMAEQILRTCYSFVIYARDFSSALCDRDGNTIMQGSQDIAVHVGTLHFTCKAVIEAFGEDIHPGDVFAVNDPYVGGTHFNDVRIVRPIFYEGEVIAYAQSNGHWADVGGSVPGSFDVNAKEHFQE